MTSLYLMISDIFAINIAIDRALEFEDVEFHGHRYLYLTFLNDYARMLLSLVNFLNCLIISKISVQRL